MDTAITTFLGGLGFNLDTFETYFPAVITYYEIIQGFAVGLLFIMLIFQIFRNFGIVLDMEVEDPLKMLGKTALFFGMIIYSRSIVNMILNLLTDPYSIFLNAYTAEFKFSLLDLLNNMIGGITTPSFMSIVYIIMLLVLGWQFLKFVVEVVERYVVFFFVLYCAPVVFATGAFKSTSQIFKSWCRMLGSQAMLLLLNVWSIKLFASFMTVFNFASGDIVFYFLLGYGFLKFSQKADSLLRILGLNTASTGDVIHSLGSTIGGIAQTLRTAGGIAGRSFGSKSGTLHGATSGSNSSSGNGQAGGMGMPGGNNSAASSGKSDIDGTGSPLGGVGKNVSSAAQAYSNEVLSSAKLQMENRSNTDFNPNGEATSSNEEHNSLNNECSNKRPFSGKPSVGDNKGTGGDLSPASSIENIDAETREGLANLAHGLPHNSYNPETRKFSGGGFAEFTGEHANIIGASQLAPADGFSQSAVKMPDGTNATLYKDNSTGQSHIVQFSSVDNGVIQGAISEVDPKTGKLGDGMAFKAVHGNVPGVGSFSSHSVPVADSEGGTYHVSTGSDTSFFKAGQRAAESSGTAFMQSASASPNRQDKNSVSSFEAGQDIVMHAANDKAFQHSPAPDSGIQSIQGSMGNSGEISQSPVSPQRATAYAEPHTTIATPSASGNFRSSSGIASEAVSVNTQSASGQNDSNRRFSRNNPANLEVFNRIGESKIETFSRDAGQTSYLSKKEQYFYEE